MRRSTPTPTTRLLVVGVAASVLVGGCAPTPRTTSEARDALMQTMQQSGVYATTALCLLDSLEEAGVDLVAATDPMLEPAERLALLGDELQVAELACVDEDSTNDRALDASPRETRRRWIAAIQLSFGDAMSTEGLVCAFDRLVAEGFAPSEIAGGAPSEELEAALEAAMTGCGLALPSLDGYRELGLEEQRRLFMAGATTPEQVDQFGCYFDGMMASGADPADFAFYGPRRELGTTSEQVLATCGLTTGS